MAKFAKNRCKNGCYRNCSFTFAGSVIYTETTAYLCPCECHKRRKRAVAGKV